MELFLWSVTGATSGMNRYLLGSSGKVHSTDRICLRYPVFLLPCWPANANQTKQSNVVLSRFGSLWAKRMISYLKFFKDSTTLPNMSRNGKQIPCVPRVNSGKKFIKLIPLYNIQEPVKVEIWKSSLNLTKLTILLMTSPKKCKYDM